MIKALKIALFCAVATAAVASQAQAASNSVVFVTLWDKGADAPMVADHGLGMTNMKMESSMGVRLSMSSVKAGEIDFKLRNASKETIHEMLVIPYKDGMKLPYDDKLSKISEDKAGSVGEVSETDSGKSGELKVKLKPGKYALLCNIPGHFANGMWSILTVK